MKVLGKILCVGMVVTLIAGCASDVYVPQLPPHAQAKLLDYFEQPNNKVFVIAVDPNGDFAYGYDYGKATTREAFIVAKEKCEASREELGVLCPPNIYAINDTVVYESSIRKTQAK